MNNPLNPHTDIAFCGDTAELSVVSSDTGEVSITFALPQGRVDLKQFAPLSRSNDLQIDGEHILVQPQGDRVTARKRVGFESSANPNFKPDHMSTADQQMRKLFITMNTKQRKLEKLIDQTQKALVAPDLPVEVIEPAPERKPLESGSLADQATATAPSTPEPAI